MIMSTVLSRLQPTGPSNASTTAISSIENKYLRRRSSLPSSKKSSTVATSNVISTTPVTNSTSPLDSAISERITTASNPNSHVSRRITVRQFLGEAAARGRKTHHASRKSCSAISDDDVYDEKGCVDGLKLGSVDTLSKNAIMTANVGSVAKKTVGAQRLVLGEKDANVPKETGPIHGRYLSFKSCLKVGEIRAKGDNGKVGNDTSKERRSLLKFKISLDSDDIAIPPLTALTAPVSITSTNTGGECQPTQQTYSRLIRPATRPHPDVPEDVTSILTSQERLSAAFHRPAPPPPYVTPRARTPTQRSTGVKRKPVIGLTGSGRGMDGVGVSRRSSFSGFIPAQNGVTPKTPSPLISSSLIASADGDSLLDADLEPVANAKDEVGREDYDRLFRRRVSYSSSSILQTAAASELERPAMLIRRRRTSPRGGWKTYHHGLSRSSLLAMRAMWEERYAKWIEHKRQAAQSQNPWAAGYGSKDSYARIDIGASAGVGVGDGINGEEKVVREGEKEVGVVAVVEKPLNPDIFPRVGNLTNLHPKKDRSSSAASYYTRYVLSVFADTDDSDSDESGTDESEPSGSKNAKVSRGTRIDYYFGRKTLGEIKRTLYLFDLDRRLREIERERRLGKGRRGRYLRAFAGAGSDPGSGSSSRPGSGDGNREDITTSWDSNWELRWEVLAAILHHRNQNAVLPSTSSSISSGSTIKGSSRAILVTSSGSIPTVGASAPTISTVSAPTLTPSSVPINGVLIMGSG